ncbi:dTDP-4-dehydrorhamnose 3,5-epimerase family protein [Streptomyces sp. NPDC008125]|uniref:dTDP-4-dehydrorhamnose 3,5-epimerase family protein n=1 Tax=Streptomyces sp. NPDC008125 TaxID=3364811 RepID=UPI0036DFBDEE
MRPLSIEGLWEMTPQQHPDPRGRFMEWYRFDRLAEVVGHPLDLAQANLAVSALGVVRGIHFADVPPGQAKFVTCPAGAVLDVIVDMREGSPTFGHWEAVRLDGDTHRAVYISEGLGHGYCALTDSATVAYLCSSVYAPERERAVHPMDADLRIEWPVLGEPRLSERDRNAPTLKQLSQEGLLPEYDACRRFTDALDAAPGKGTRR